MHEENIYSCSNSTDFALHSHPNIGRVTSYPDVGF
jgi:hypothetical protein